MKSGASDRGTRPGDPPKNQDAKVGQILAVATRSGYVSEISCTNCEDPSHTDDNCTSTEKTCNWCKEAGHSRVTCPKAQCSNC
ncbi:uncharacterized protein GLRG_02458 [Colletotrichum graminicola M1.001]|uniref:CCHC-type domain-containing protein n=1 Tax=Colletotrichum graminicola (strain M1.001 / M2 / FGSC 10212) TaxID=645133 RepID=E3Q700_COLGM|nr:uncharacterized protein GLRG_02458 [Colletotrichum graminicola M1.001]EFQ26638.1 hypothetical protein GLRG_02458 [Colletotrichum graminicola M1.001]